MYISLCLQGKQTPMLGSFSLVAEFVALEPQLKASRCRLGMHILLGLGQRETRTLLLLRRAVRGVSYAMSV